MQAWAIDPSGVRRGLLDVHDAQAVMRDAGVHTWVLGVAMDGLARRVGDGWSVLIVDGAPLLSGPVAARRVSTDQGHLSLELSGVGELHRLADRITYPSPTAPLGSQGDYYRASGPAETVIRNLVHLNAGTEALPARQSPRFSVTISQGRGSAARIQTRFQSLLEEAQAIARLGGVTFDAIYEQDRRAILRFREPRDLSRRIRFPVEDDGHFSITAPTVTDVIVAGQGSGAARTLRPYSESTTWGRRIETFRDRRDSDDQADHDKAGAEALAEGAAKASASLPVAEAEGRIFGVDFLLGDRVTAVMAGESIQERVRQAQITWHAHGRTVRLVLGDHQDSDDADDEWRTTVRRLDARVRRQEAT